MPAEQSEAIVLRAFSWSETSVIATLYTRDFGKLGTLAKGARRPKSPFEAALDLLSSCRVVFIPKSGDALDLLTEAKLVRRFRAGSQSLIRLNCGYYLAELLDRLTDRGDPQPELFDLAETTLQTLEDTTSDLRAVVLRFELQMLRLTGHLPSWRQCAQCGTAVEDGRYLVIGLLAGGTLCGNCQSGGRHMLRIPGLVRDTLEYFSQSDWRSMDVHNFTTDHRSAIRSLMTRYLTIMLDRKLNLHPYLEELGR